MNRDWAKRDESERIQETPAIVPTLNPNDCLFCNGTRFSGKKTVTSQSGQVYEVLIRCHCSPLTNAGRKRAKAQGEKAMNNPLQKRTTDQIRKALRRAILDGGHIEAAITCLTPSALRIYGADDRLIATIEPTDAQMDAALEFWLQHQNPKSARKPKREIKQLPKVREARAITKPLHPARGKNIDCAAGNAKAIRAYDSQF